MDDLVTGTAGNDTLSAGSGNDVYSIGLNEGVDVIADGGSAGDIDTLRIHGGDILTSLSQLEFTAIGDDLRVRGYAPGGATVLDVTIDDMAGSSGRIEKLELFSRGDLSDPETLNLVQIWSGGQPASPAADTFADDFSRADGAVGNGWSQVSTNADDLEISGGVLTEPLAGGGGAIYRPYDLSMPVLIAFTTGQITGYGGATYRFSTRVLFGNDGDDHSGLSVNVHRGDQHYSDSRVELAFSGTPIASIASTFQFTTSVDVMITLGADYRVYGTISSGSNSFSFDFGPQAVTLPGGYIAISQDGPDSRANPASYIFPVIDNIVISHPDDYAPSGTGTVGALDIDDTVAGRLEQASDTDWFAVELEAGEAYAFLLTGSEGGGGTLADPYLELRDGSGNLLTADDEVAGAARDAAITFVAPTSGTYYLVAAGDRLTAGTYTLSASSVTALGGGASLAGGSGADRLVGSDQGDALAGLGGADVLLGRAGDDVLEGGDGNDSLIGGAGADTAAYAAAGSGVTVNLAITTAQNTGGAGTDTLAGIENLLGSAYADTLTGDGGGNVIEGGAGNDTLDGAGGVDTVTYASAGSAVTVTLAVATAQGTGGAGSDIVKNFENLVGSAYGDTLTGSSVINEIYGGLGADSLYGGGNNDILYGGDGADLLDGGTANDTLYGGAGVDSLTGGDGKDTLDGGAGDDSLDGGAGDDTYVVDSATDAITEGASAGGDTVQATSSSFTLGANLENLTNIAAGTGAFSGTGNSLVNIITGAAGADSLYGLDGNDKLYGGDGADLLYGGAGGDLIYGGAGADAFIIQAASESYAVADAIGDFSHAEGDYIDLSGIDADSGTGGDQAFSFIGGSAFSHTAGELRYQVSGGIGFLYGDVNGDGTADLIIKVNGGPTLVAGDFHP